MTTILKAAQQLERAGAATLRPPLRAQQRRFSWVLIAVVLLAVVTSAVVLIVSLRGHRIAEPGGLRLRVESPKSNVQRPASDVGSPTSDVEGPTSPLGPENLGAARSSTGIGVPVAVPPVAQPQKLHAQSVAPWARVETSPKSRVRSPRSRVQSPESEVQGGQESSRGATIRRNRGAPVAVGPERAPAMPATADVVPGEPGLRVESIDYTANPIERRVTLSVGGGPSVALHEGESAGGVEVQLILEKVVYLRRGGNVFAISAAR